VSVVLSIEDVGPCRKQLKVEVPAPAVEAESKRVVEEYRKQAKLPGFRKGKVPTELVKQKFHKEIEQDVVERLLPRYWQQAEAEAELDPLMPPSVDEVDFQPGAPLTFVAWTTSSFQSWKPNPPKRRSSRLSRTCAERSPSG
jgi:trigger factor